ncbi:hypothetical protein Tdes44962_MAKER02618 [Teratosphaeria destructans]|uniref:Uncharacterized protein n=1 Tax=Teratosphaeria destructans TaxID=418781 RepID=A0A9W7W2P0_9PEZI|nr:hypothetical protein Tdes44962_MAKER02618 [Teratosphaeria destructans]
MVADLKDFIDDATGYWGMSFVGLETLLKNSRAWLRGNDTENPTDDMGMALPSRGACEEGQDGGAEAGSLERRKSRAVS